MGGQFMQYESNCLYTLYSYMSIMHTTWWITTKLLEKIRTLNIIGPITGHTIYSNKYISVTTGNITLGKMYKNYKAYH